MFESVYLFKSVVHSKGLIARQSSIILLLPHVMKKFREFLDINVSPIFTRCISSLAQYIDSVVF